MEPYASTAAVAMTTARGELGVECRFSSLRFPISAPWLFVKEKVFRVWGLRFRVSLITLIVSEATCLTAKPYLMLQQNSPSFLLGGLSPSIQNKTCLWGRQHTNIGRIIKFRPTREDCKRQHVAEGWSQQRNMQFTRPAKRRTHPNNTMP